MRAAAVAVVGLGFGTFATAALAADAAPAPPAPQPPAVAQAAPEPPPVAQAAPATQAAPAAQAAPATPAVAQDAPRPPPAAAPPGAARAEPGKAQRAHEHAGRRRHHRADDADRDHLTAGVDAVVGFARLDKGLDRSDVVSLLLGAEYHFAPWFNLGLRWPVSVGSLAGEVGRSAVGNVGNVELAPEVAIRLARGVALPVGLGLALPTAGGDVFAADDAGARKQAHVNAIASATRGGEVTALFASKRFGLVPRLALQVERGPIEAALFTKAELMFRAGGEDALPSDHIDGTKLAVEWVTGAHIYFRALPRRVSIGARAFLDYVAQEGATRHELPACTATITKDCKAPGAAGADHPQTQFVIEPSMKVAFGAFRGSVGYILPIGGFLGDVGAGGVRLTLGGVY